ncbi:MAG: hypothetical protein AAF197_06080 [Pseudomonadota bacterium]
MQGLFQTALETLNSLILLFAGGANIVGIALVLTGLFGLARSGTQQPLTGRSSAWHLWSVLIGSLLIISAKLLDVTSFSMFEQESRKILDNTLLPTGGINEQARYMIGTVYAVVAAVGFFGFLRGWLLLRGSGAGMQVGRGLTFIIAGCMAVNLDVVMRITANTVSQFNAELANDIRLFIPG